jgi:hypothetical protein
MQPGKDALLSLFLFLFFGLISDLVRPPADFQFADAPKCRDSYCPLPGIATLRAVDRLSS